MEDSSAQELTQGRVYISYHNCFIVEAFKAVLRCLGVGDRTPESPSTSELTTKPQEAAAPAAAPAPAPTTTTTTQADPSSVSSEDPPANASVSLLSAPPRPPVSSGSGPQIN